MQTLTISTLIAIFALTAYKVMMYAMTLYDVANQCGALEFCK